MRSKLNRMMAKGKPHMPAYVPVRTKREIRILDKTKPLLPAPEATQWLVVMVEPRCEEKAIKGLQEAGHLAWHPQMTAWRVNYRLKLREKLNQPLFPRYIFVAKGEQATKSVVDCDHVSKVIGGVPRIRQSDRDLVSDLSTKQQHGWFTPGGPASPFKVNDEVAINDDGAFHGLQGLVEKTDAERSTILLEILGTYRKFEVETDSLRKVA